MRPPSLRISAITVTLASVLCVGLTGSASNQDNRPELTLRARPNTAFAPVEIVFTGRIRGGDDNNEEFYCLSAEWDWGDGTTSESIFDCDPYEPSSSEIRRRFSRRHSYRTGGRYEIRLNLKRRDDVVESARTSVVIQGGVFRD